MFKPNLLCPVNTYDSAKAQVKLGADEIYVGLLMKDDFDYTFSGRTNRPDFKTNPEYEELKDIVNLCKDKGVPVNFAANKPFLTNDADGGTTVLKRFEKYVQNGLDLGVDNFIIGSLQNIRFLQDNGFKAPIHTSVFNSVFNQEHVRYLSDIPNVIRVVLPQSISREELGALTEKFPDIEFEVFAHFGCSNLNAQCRLIHNFGEKEYLGLPCRNPYEVYHSGKSLGISTFMDTGMDCSICSIGDLTKLKVHTLKLVGRTFDYRFSAGITKIYREAIDMYCNGSSVSDVQQNTYKRIPIFKDKFCSKNRCKYKESQPLYNYFI